MSQKYSGKVLFTTKQFAVINEKILLNDTTPSKSSQLAYLKVVNPTFKRGDTIKYTKANRTLTIVA